MSTLVGPYDCSSGTNFTAVSGHNKGNFSGTYQGGHGDGWTACYESAYSGSWPNDQYSQAKIVVVSTNAGDGAGPLCRHTTGQYYYVRCTTTATNLLKYVSGVRTSLGTAAAVTANSIIKLECNGTSIKVYDDGVEIISATDSSLTGGQAGMFAYGGGSSYGSLDDWEAGDLASNFAPSPDVGSITSAGYAPTVNIVSGPVSIPIGAGSTATTTYDLSVGVANSSSIPVAVGSQQFTTYAESVGIGFGVPEGTGPEAAFPDDTNLGITGQVPQIGTIHVIPIGVGSVTVSTYAPSVDVQSPAGMYIAVGAGAITATTYAPIDETSEIQLLDVGTITISTYAPSANVTTFSSHNISIDQYDNVITGNSYTFQIVEINRSIPIPVGSLVLPGWKLPYGTEPSVEIGLRKRRKILGFLK